MIFPFSSLALDMLKAAMSDATAIQTADTAMNRPGHILGMKSKSTARTGCVVRNGRTGDQNQISHAKGHNLLYLLYCLSETGQV